LYTIWILLLTHWLDVIIFEMNLMTSGSIFDIKRYAINDGPGIRTAIFFKGCPLECWWCHNPEGQSNQPQLMFRSNRCKAFKACLEACPEGAIHWENGSRTDWGGCNNCGRCAEVCYAGARELVGRIVSVSQLIGEIERDIPFYDQSKGGVTFTGGEPMYQREFLYESLQACKKQGIHTAVDTSGYSAWEGFEIISPLVDLFLYDLKLMDEIKHKKYTAVSNHLILGNLQKLSRAKAHIIVRIPLIPGVNDDDKNIELSAAFLAGLPYLDQVELMPYHEIGLEKYQALGMQYNLKDTHPTTSQHIVEIERILTLYQLPVKKHSSGSSI
jgi:pyruvate formate lyase activating enzyme